MVLRSVCCGDDFMLSQGLLQSRLIRVRPCQEQEGSVAPPMIIMCLTGRSASLSRQEPSIDRGMPTCQDGGLQRTCIWQRFQSALIESGQRFQE